MANHYYYRNSADYVKEFILPFIQTKHPDTQILRIKNISSSSTYFPQQGQTATYGPTASSALFSYTSNGKQYLIGVGVITGGTKGEGLNPGVWYVTVFGISAPKSDFYNVSNLSQAVFLSPKINKDWAIDEIHGRESRGEIISDVQKAIENIINQHKPSGMNDKLSQAWSNEIIGSSDWVSKTGEHYNLPNDFQHYWIDPSQHIAASNTDTSPGPEFTPLIPANTDKR